MCGFVLQKNSQMDGQLVPQYDVFISFSGKDVRTTFLSFLKEDLKRNGIKVYTDEDERRGKKLETLFERIKESRMALVIFSEKFTKSYWCLSELQVMRGNGLEVIPIFHEIKTATVTDDARRLAQLFPDDIYINQYKTFTSRTHKEETIKKWKATLEYFTQNMGMKSSDYRNQNEFSKAIVEEVKKVLTDISSNERENCFVNGETHAATTPSDDNALSPRERERLQTQLPLFGIERRLETLEEKLDLEHHETRIVGVVGMPGIGKTTLTEMLFQRWEHKFLRRMLFLDIRKMWKEYGSQWLRKRLLEELLKDSEANINFETTHKSVEADLLERKVFLVLDDVSSKAHIESLLGDCQWIKEGSRIIITTSDKSLIQGLVHDTYVVMGLDDIDGLRYFNCHAFGNSTHIPEGKLMELSRKFVDYTRGNPLALKVLGGELRLHQKDEAHWESKLHTLAQSPNKTIQNILRISYDELSEQQKDAFLDVACFFRSENVCYVTSLVDSCVTECTQDRSEIRDLADKFLINISGGRVEMHDLLCTLGKDLGSQASIANKGARRRLWNHRDIVSVLKNKLGTGSVRGIFLDMSGVTKNMPLDCKTFTRMENLRYLKFYNSCCHRECETDCKLNLPDRLEFPLHEVRYLHWLKFPLEELPPEFNPKNLIDLRLPYSKIRRVWNGVKDTSKLKWVDLNHSSKLCELSGLVGAQNLQRLNLEGCTDLETLPEGMQDMKSLLYLNMRGCTRLRSLPEMKLDSLKTLILSGCSDLQQFQVISEKLEALYLDGTAIKGLPQAIGKLQRLVLLNLKCCKMLESLPSCLGELKALQELVLSGCSSLDKFPDVNENMNCLETLLLDGTAIKEMPKILRSRTSIGQASVDMSLPPTSGFSHPRSLSLSYHGLCEWPLNINGLYLLRRLCLSRNEMICSLQANISQLYHLKWLDLKYCKNLTSLPMLPPNLECLDAHGCDKLKTVASPLALFMLAEQIHSTFIFSNCKEMEQGAKDHITSYAQRKSQLISDALNRYNGGIVMEAFVSTCFPGSRVPSWFSHQVVGSVLERELPRHWCDRRLAGIALCAVVSFQHHQDQTTCFLVKCTCEFKNGDGSCNSFSCTVGGWSEPGNEPREIELDHVFIGYSSWLHIQKDHPEDHEKGCMPTDASFKFEVKDGTREVPNCKVLKCGFSLVYAPDEADNMFCEVNSDVIPRKDINIPVEARSSITSRKDAAIRSEAICHITPMKDNNVPSQVNSYRRENDIQSHSNFSLTPRRDYSFCSETNPYATPTRDDNLHGRAESHATLSWQNSIWSVDDKIICYVNEENKQGNRNEEIKETDYRNEEIKRTDDQKEPWFPFLLNFICCLRIQEKPKNLRGQVNRASFSGWESQT